MHAGRLAVLEIVFCSLDRILPYGVRRAENTKTTKKDKGHKEFIAEST